MEGGHQGRSFPRIAFLLRAACENSVFICQAVRAMLRFKRGMRGWSGAPASDSAPFKLILPCAYKPWCLTRLMHPIIYSPLSLYLSVHLSVRHRRWGASDRPHFARLLREQRSVGQKDIRFCLSIRIPFPTPDAAPPDAEGDASGHHRASGTAKPPGLCLLHCLQSLERQKSLVIRAEARPARLEGRAADGARS